MFVPCASGWNPCVQFDSSGNLTPDPHTWFCSGRTFLFGRSQSKNPPSMCSTATVTIITVFIKLMNSWKPAKFCWPTLMICLCPLKLLSVPVACLVWVMMLTSTSHHNWYHMDFELSFYANLFQITQYTLYAEGSVYARSPVWVQLAALLLLWKITVTASQGRV